MFSIARHELGRAVSQGGFDALTFLVVVALPGLTLIMFGYFLWGVAAGWWQLSELFR